MVISELSKLSPRELKQVKSVVTFFHMIGLTDEDINLLPQIVKNWPAVAKNINLFGKQIIEMKGDIEDLETRGGNKNKDGKSSDTTANIRQSVGIGSDIQRVHFNFDDQKKGD